MPEEYRLMAGRLTALRKQTGKTRGLVARELNVDQSTYGKYELGLRQPSLEMLCRLAEYFGVSADYLTGLSDDKSNSAGEGDETFAILRRAQSMMSPEQRKKAINILKATFDEIDWDNPE